MATYVGATQVRRMVLGDDDRDPTPAELERMRELVRQAMRDGAVGLSTSLQYPPAPYAETEELIALAAEAAKFGGIYATHMRSESDDIVPALDEAIRIGREAGIPVEIWHLKTAGKPNWGRMPDDRGQDRLRAPGRRRYRRRYVRLSGLVQLPVVVRARLGPRRRHRQAALARLEDPATRARIKRDIGDVHSEWENSWRMIPGPEAILIGAVHNPALQTVPGKDAGRRGEEPRRRADRRAARPADRGQGLHLGRRVRDERARRGAGAGAAVGLDQLRFRGRRARGHPVADPSASSGLRHLSREFSGSTCGRSSG